MRLLRTILRYRYKATSIIVLIRRKLFELFGSARYSRPALNEIDRKLEKYFNYRNGFFIEAGAYDGFLQSNTYFLEKFMGWRGVLVEGIPQLYKRCKKERPNSQIFNSALVSSNYTQSFVKMHFADLMSVVDGSFKNNNDQHNHLKKGLQILRLKNTFEVNVPARTIESILDEVKPPDIIDLFSLDVEGYELQVLEGLNINKYRPKYILVEVRNLEEINNFLIPTYELIDKLSYHDFLYKLKNK